MKVFRIVLLILVALIALAPVASALISPPRGGQELAAKLAVPYPAVVAHRGLSYHAPEETAIAYLAARELGADYLEGDVQRTRDGVLILFHDDTPARNTNAAQVFPGRENQTIDQFTWAELERLDAGTWFNEKYPERARPEFAGAKILRLDQFLGLAAGGKNRPGIYLETKAASRFPGIEAQLVALLRARGWIGANASAEQPAERDQSLVRVGLGPARTLLQSFELDSLKTLRQLAPDAPLVYLIDQPMVREQGWSKLLADAKAVGVGIGPVGYEAWPWRTGPAHRADLIVHPYTINQIWQMRMLGFFGVDGFFTDRAELMLVLQGRRDSIELSGIFENLATSEN